MLELGKEGGTQEEKIQFTYPRTPFHVNLGLLQQVLLYL